MTLEYFRFRDNLSRDLVGGLIDPNIDAIFERARACSGLDAGTADEFSERFVQSLGREIARMARG